MVWLHREIKTIWDSFVGGKQAVIDINPDSYESPQTFYVRTSPLLPCEESTRGPHPGANTAPLLIVALIQKSKYLKVFEKVFESARPLSRR